MHLSISAPSGQSTKERRNLLNSELNSYKHEKLKWRLPADSQLLSIAQEDSKIKKQMLDKMEVMDREYCKSMKSLSTNIVEKLTNSITDGFSMFRHVLLAQTQMLSAPAPPTPCSQPNFEVHAGYQDQPGPLDGSHQYFTL